MILDYGYLANGFKPQRILGLGFIVRRYGTDAAAAAVTLTADYLYEIEGPTTRLYAIHGSDSSLHLIHGANNALYKVPG